MYNRKKIGGILLFSILICAGCNEESVDFENNDLELFKKLSSIQFQGRVMDKDIYWRFDNWNNGIGKFSETFWCVEDDKTIQQRNFSIYDYEKRDHINMLKIVSPAFSIKDNYEVKLSIFDVGKKNFHLNGESIYNGFIIQGNSADTCFSTQYGPQNESSFEVVRVQELLPDSPESPDYKKTKLWIAVTCNLYSCDGKNIGRIENGRFITEVEIERNE